MSSAMRSGGHQIASGHLSILGMLSERAYTLGELAEMLVVSAPTMSNTITALEERGWVTRTRSTEDRRVVLVEIAPTGSEVLQTIRDHTRDRIADLLDGLSPEERTVLLDGLTLLRDSFYKAFERYREDSTPDS
jgi:DNA-binding MarR family transcriptional regulator